MNAITVSPSSLTVIRSIVLAFKRLFTKNKESYVDEVKVNEALYKTTYNLLILENGWVKNVYKYLKGFEICTYTGIEKSKIVAISEKVTSEGIYRLVKRNGIFKKREFNITGFWDY